MLKGVSEDINAVIDWELAHGNAIAIPPKDFEGNLIVVMVRHVRTTVGGSPRLLPPSLRPWEFRDAHYAENQWLAGFRSDVSGQVVCGPLELHNPQAGG